MSCRLLLSINQLAAMLLLAVMTPVLADGVPPPGAVDPTRPVSLPDVPKAPVYIDSAYVDILGGPTGEPNFEEDTGCFRFRNLASETIVLARFKRAFLDAKRHLLGSDSIEDHKARKPNRNAMPGTVPVAAGYWDCWDKPNRYGSKVASVSIYPTFVKFSSGKTWRLP